MRIFYKGYSEEGGFGELFCDGVADNPHCITDEFHRVWLEYLDGRWSTSGVPKKWERNDSDSRRGLAIAEDIKVQTVP